MRMRHVGYSSIYRPKMRRNQQKRALKREKIAIARSISLFSCEACALEVRECLLVQVGCTAMRSDVTVALNHKRVYACLA